MARPFSRRRLSLYLSVSAVMPAPVVLAGAKEMPDHPFRVAPMPTARIPTPSTVETFHAAATAAAETHAPAAAVADQRHVVVDGGNGELDRRGHGQGIGADAQHCGCHTDRSDHRDCLQ